MSAEYYTPGPDRAGKVHDLFGRIARRYDLINDLQSLGMHRLWKRQVVRLSRVEPGSRALDLCCGTGDIGELLAAKGARVFGCDFSVEMMQAAPARNQTQSFVQGDALKLPFSQSSFAVVTVGYGLRNLADFEAGVREMLRVTKPGGRVLILDFGRPENPVWRALYFTYLRAVVPLFGRVFAGNAAAYRYILESLEHYPAQRGIAELLRKFKCEEVEVHDLLGGVMSIHSARAPATRPVPQGIAENG